ncbi:MAG: T9SS type A sorting domain-containing protein [Bacteroidales bacterium]|nr:T9SS type A sorting domain-containing protein [Bacteroidales bacterium]
MKKIILLTYLLSIAVFFGYSQSLSLVHNSNPVANDEAINFNGEPSTSVINSFIGVVNNGSTALSVKCKKVEISLIPDTENAFCWDVCYGPDIYVSIGWVDIDPGVTNTAFTGDYSPQNHAGQSIIRYVFFDANNPNDSVCFRALYNAYPLGMENHEVLASLSAAYPNPASVQASFSYSVERGATALLLVRNVLGSTVKEVSLTGSGMTSISTLDLSEGIYFYSLVVNGKTESTRKLVVSH